MPDRAKIQEHLQELLKNYGPNETGLWEVEGPDESNGNYGDRPQHKKFGTVEGRYIDVVKWALSQRGFIGGWASKPGTIWQKHVTRVGDNGIVIQEEQPTFEVFGANHA